MIKIQLKNRTSKTKIAETRSFKLTTQHSKLKFCKVFMIDTTLYTQLFDSRVF